MDGSSYAHEEEGKGIPRVLQEGLVLQLDPAFALQLQEIFGSVGYNADINIDQLLDEDLEVQIDLNLAKMIYTLFRGDSLRRASEGNDDVEADRRKAIAVAVMEEDGKGVPIKFHGGMVLRLQPAFVIQLEELFRPDYEEHDRSIIVSLEEAKRIHSAWCRTFRKNVESLLDGIKEDEEFARYLQQEEGIHYNHDRHITKGSEHVMQQGDEALARQLQDFVKKKKEAEDEYYYMAEHRAAGLHVLEGNCSCGNSNEKQFWEIYEKPYERFLGVCCKKKTCQQEYFVERICQDEDENKDPYVIFWRGVRLLEKYPVKPDHNGGFQANLAREPVTKISSLNKGDHIMWARKYIIWHHAIVVDVGNGYFQAIHWHKDGTVKIMEEQFGKEGLSGLFRVIYRNIYSGADEAHNRMLTVARAYSRLHKANDPSSKMKPLILFGDYNTDYGLFNANCEHFATYCVLGRGICHQSLWLRLTALATVNKTVLKSGIPAMVSELIENLARKPEIWGAGGLILMEILSLTSTFFNLRSRYRKGTIIRSVFLQELGKSIGGFVGGCTLGAMTGILLAFCPPLEVIVTPCVAIVGRIIGENIGFLAASCITNKHETDDTYLGPGEELEMGDHIVQTKHMGCAETHGVFLERGTRGNHIVAIMFHEHHVRKEEIPLEKVKRVIYYDTENVDDGATVVAKAWQFLEDPQFRQMSRKRQVRWCKMKSEHIE